MESYKNSNTEFSTLKINQNKKSEIILEKSFFFIKKIKRVALESCYLLTSQKKQVTFNSVITFLKDNLPKKHPSYDAIRYIPNSSFEFCVKSAFLHYKRKIENVNEENDFMYVDELDNILIGKDFFNYDPLNDFIHIKQLGISSFIGDNKKPDFLRIVKHKSGSYYINTFYNLNVAIESKSKSKGHEIELYNGFNGETVKTINVKNISKFKQCLALQHNHTGLHAAIINNNGSMVTVARNYNSSDEYKIVYADKIIEEFNGKPLVIVCDKKEIDDIKYRSSNLEEFESFYLDDINNTVNCPNLDKFNIDKSKGIISIILDKTTKISLEENERY